MFVFHIQETIEDEKKDIRSYYAYVTARPYKDHRLAILRLTRTSGKGTRDQPRVWCLQAFWTAYRTQSKFKAKVDTQGSQTSHLHRALGRRLLTFAMQTLVQSGRIGKDDLITVIPAALMYVEPERNSQERIEAYYHKLGFEPDPKSLYWSTTMQTLLSRL